MRAAAPSEGKVTLEGDPVRAHQTEIGYVPQDEIVHPLLTVYEALSYAARLRLPDDTSDDEVEQAAAGVMDELGLRERANTRIANLSGGQRKRVGVGTELVNQPQLLFLDEATTGLDPILERRMMEMMRGLADRGRTVITVTHATRNLDLCDEVIVMGEGGHLCFKGAPRDAREFFEVRATDEIYAALDRLPVVEWQRRWSHWSSSPGGEEQHAATGTTSAPSAVRRDPVRQTAILSRRYFTIFLRDRRNLLLLVAQVPILAAAIAALYPKTVWGSGSGDDVSGIIFLIVTLAIWLGAIDSSREIIKERTVIEREAAVGVGRLPYLLSKAAVLSGLAVVQTLLLLLVIAVIRPGAPDEAALLGLVLVTTLTAAAMGLLISASVKTENQAVSLIPLALIPQLLFAGQIVPYASMAAPLKAISYVIFARWAFAGAGHSADIASRFPPHQLATTFGHSFFSLPTVVTVCILVLFTALFACRTLARLPRGTH